MIPQRLADIIFNLLGRAPAQIKIMMVLCGTNGNMIPVNLAGITAFLAAASAMQTEEAPEQEETPPTENTTSKRRKPKGVSAP